MPSMLKMPDVELPKIDLSEFEYPQGRRRQGDRRCRHRGRACHAPAIALALRPGRRPDRRRGRLGRDELGGHPRPTKPGQVLDRRSGRRDAGPRRPARAGRRQRARSGSNSRSSPRRSCPVKITLPTTTTSAERARPSPPTGDRRRQAAGSQTAVGARAWASRPRAPQSRSRVRRIRTTCGYSAAKLSIVKPASANASRYLSWKRGDGR